MFIFLLDNMCSHHATTINCHILYSEHRIFLAEGSLMHSLPNSWLTVFLCHRRVWKGDEHLSYIRWHTGCCRVPVNTEPPAGAMWKHDLDSDVMLVSPLVLQHAWYIYRCTVMALSWKCIFEDKANQFFYWISKSKNWIWDAASVGY
jgi:hypothetical protein